MAEATPTLFISYASADRDRVLPIAAAIEAAGIPVWIDREGIGGGESYAAAIADAIRSAAAVVVVCSAAAFASRNVHQEIALAWKHERRIVPLRVEPVEPPKELEYWLEAAQWIDAFGGSGERWLSFLLRAVGRAGPDVPVPATPLVPAASATSPPPTNLPAPLTGLVGRDAEIAYLSHLLSSARLVTLTGPGGVGKTRLALDVAGRVRSDFSDGVWFVDLAHVGEAQLVLPAIAQTLGIGGAAGQSLRDGVLAFLGGRRALLVADNFEHVVDAAPLIAEILARCPNVRVLATSRVPLHLAGEREQPVDPLPVPPPGSSPTLSQTETTAAVALFLERARSVKPGFALTEENAPAVAEICRRLDGLPLAIELAATRIKVLSPPALLARLEQRLPLLTGGAQDLPDRQRTLRDAIQWSHDLLSDADRTLFARLGVFSGGWTLEAAEAICGFDGAFDIFEGIASLVDKSLVREQASRGDETRFGMLETLREFAVEHLEASGEADRVRGKAAAWFRSLTERAAPDFDRGLRIGEWFARFDDELPNIRDTLAWFEQTRDGPSILVVVGNTDEFWSVRPHMAEARRWIEIGLALGPDAPLAVRARALHVATFASYFSGDYSAALGYAGECLSAATAMDDALAIGRAHFNLGATYEMMGDHHRSIEAYARSVPLLKQADMLAWAGLSLGNQADQALLGGLTVDTAPLLDEALDLVKTTAYPPGVAIVLAQCGYAARATGDLVTAQRCFMESFEVAHTNGLLRLELGAVAGLAAVALDAGQLETTTRALGAIESEAKRSGTGRVAHREHVDRTKAAARAALGEAEFERLWREGQGTPYAAAVASMIDQAGRQPDSVPAEG